MKKKFFVIFLALVMSLMLVACGTDESSEEGEFVEDDSEYEVGDYAEGSAFGSFASTDLYGYEVTDAIFANADVTIVNVWGTFCGPCVGEMPDLAALDAELPDNVQIIGMVCDAAEGETEMIETAIGICEENGVGYTNVLANDSVYKITDSFSAVPTTLIVDSNGVLVCDPIVGADVEAYRQAVADYLGW